MRTLKTLRSIVGYRLTQIEERNTTSYVPDSPYLLSPETGEASPALIRAWARSQGLYVKDKGRVPFDIRAAYYAAMAESVDSEYVATDGNQELPDDESFFDPTMNGKHAEVN
jgi:hypothetical protein